MYSVRLGDQRISPSKVLCIGRNYVEHIKELNNAIPEQMVDLTSRIPALPPP